MGGRGASSASSGVGNRSLSEMSYSQLGSELKKIEAKMDGLRETMERTAGAHVGFMTGMPGSSESDSKKYRSAQREFQAMQGARSKVIDEMAKKKPKEKARPKTFVNGFGEATTREITSASYQRAQKRLDKAVLRNMGY